MKALPNHSYARWQRGIVLPVALILLLVLTISSLVIVEQITSQTRIASNAAVADINLEAAESGLRTVVNELSSGTISSAPSTYVADANGYYYFVPGNYSSSAVLPWENTTIWTALSNSPAITCSSPGSYMAITSCKYMIEMLPAVKKSGNSYNSYVFRITVRVVGPSKQGAVMLQTLYTIPASS